MSRRHVELIGNNDAVELRAINLKKRGYFSEYPSSRSSTCFRLGRFNNK